MSGFAGVISLDGAPPDMRLLERMAQSLAFRGPDGTHIATKPGAGFCFTFLRTGPAPQCPSQPCSLDGKVWLLGDVRLDGRADLRRRLEQHGDEIAADVTDEELVLRAWRRWNEDSLPGLIGDYSFALWDAEALRLWCVRDLMGARPFFYAQAGNRLYFSNTLNTIRCAPDISSALDEHYIGDFLLEGWCPEGARTAFRDISRLPPGHVLRCSIDGLTVSRCASLAIEEPLWLEREQEYLERFHELFKRAVCERLPRGSSAIFMSGGLDSTAVAAMAIDVANGGNVSATLRAYTIDCRPLFDDKEGKLASRAAKYFGIPIDISSFGACLPFAGGADGRMSTPEPSQQPYLLHEREQYRKISGHARVIFNGYGGDGVLTGQAWPYLRYLLQRNCFGEVAKNFGGYFLKHRRFPPLRGGFRVALRRLFHDVDPMAGYPRWFAADFETELGLRERWRELRQPQPKLHRWHPEAYAALSGSYWASVLECDDAAWNCLPVQSRAPLLDLRIIRFLLRVPPVPLCMDKELLRRTMRGMLPEEIRLRPKTPLEGDPMASQVEAGIWSPFPLPTPTASVRSFVDWDEFKASLGNTSDSSWWSKVRPLLLHYWLKGVESDQRIEYSRS
jgi:asparagine synthase (glutamine-hydrolysing)